MPILAGGQEERFFDFMQLHPQVQALLQDCIQLRQDLHRIPETGFDLFKTHAFVMQQLEACQPDRLETMATTGIKAVFLPRTPGKPSP